MKELDPSSHISQNSPVYADEELIQFLTRFHDEKNGAVVPPSGFEIVPAVNAVLSTQDKQEGSVDLYHKASDIKLFLLKDQGDEDTKTEKLRQNDIAVISYADQIETPYGKYLIGTLPGDAVNAQLYNFHDRQPSSYFGVFDIMKDAAKTLRKIHDLGFWYQTYTIDHFILSSSLSHPLSLYKNHSLTALTDSEQKTHDIKTFMHSVEGPNQEILRKHFLDSYNHQ
jgi:hypothetical protein